jgi:hypothetical protein
VSFVDAKNQRGEIQTVPEHYLEAFPDQFRPVDSTESVTSESKSTPPAKAATSKES